MKKQSNKAIGTGLVSAFAASLCCITPVIAMIGGISGISSTFSWLEPLRPYLMALTVGALGYAWYKNIQIARNEIECACDDEPEKKNFLNTRGFLIGVTIMSAVLMAVPYYSYLLVSDDSPEIVYVNQDNVVELEYEIDGMTCPACEIHVNKSAKMIDGVLSAESVHQTGIAHIKYDKSKANSEDIIKSIEKETGYKIIKQTEKIIKNNMEK